MLDGFFNVWFPDLYDRIKLSDIKQITINVGEKVDFVSGAPKIRVDKEEVVFGDYVKSSNGNYVKDMWFTTIVSFVDIEIGLLPTKPVEGNKYLITTPKTKSSYRTIPMPNILVDDLKILKEY